MIIVVDSDGIIGSLNPDDIHYPISQKILTRLVGHNIRFLYPATTIAESTTFLQGRLNKPELATKVLDLVKENKLDIEPVDNKLLQEASLFTNFKGSEHHTLFDGIVAATAQKYKADAIFSFDKFYKNKGFKLASEL